jgi:membrane protein implicated in regulation of membrane protease activity
LKGAGWEARSDQSFEPGDRVVITGLDGIRVTVSAVDARSTADQEAQS